MTDANEPLYAAPAVPNEGAQRPHAAHYPQPAPLCNTFFAARRRDASHLEPSTAHASYDRMSKIARASPEPLIHRDGFRPIPSFPAILVDVSTPLLQNPLALWPLKNFGSPIV